MTKRTLTPGFTLLEFVVAAAVILVLAILVTSIFIRRRQNELRATCLENMKGIGYAFRLYSMDFDGKFPPAGPGQSTTILGPKAGWVSTVDDEEDWIGNSDVFLHCPSSPVPMDPTDPDQIDYGYNATVAIKTRSNVPHPASTVDSFEASQDDGINQTASTADTSRVILDRHQGGSNYLFVDGHVKWLESADHPGITPASSNNFTFAT